MAQFWLTNTVSVAGIKNFAGDMIDDTIDPAAAVRAAGGFLYAKGLTASIDAAALKAQAARLQRGASEAELDAIMQSALDALQGAQAKENETLIPIAAGTTIHAQSAAGAPINITSGFTMPYPRRCVRIVQAGVGSVATVYTVTGTDIAGNALVETISSPGAGTVNGTRAFESITSITSNVDPGGTTDYQTSTGFALSTPFSALDVLSVNGVVEAAASSHGATGTVVPTTAPDGAKVFCVRYQ